MIRLAFNDAIGTDPTVGGGGADGSLVTFSDVELQDEANFGLEEIVRTVRMLVVDHEIEAGDMSVSTSPLQAPKPQEPPT